MKKILYVLLFVIFTACDHERPQKDEVINIQVAPALDTLKSIKMQKGFKTGMTTTGKLGLEISPGVVLGFDGSLEVGFVIE